VQHLYGDIEHPAAQVRSGFDPANSCAKAIKRWLRELSVAPWVALSLLWLGSISVKVVDKLCSNIVTLPNKNIVRIAEVLLLPPQFGFRKLNERREQPALKSPG